MIIGEGYIHRCPAGLIVWASPLVFSGEYVGGIIAGQVLMWEIDEMVKKEVTQLANACGIPPRVLLAAAKQLPVMEAQTVQAASDLLFMVAAYISNQEHLSLLEQREISNQQALLAESIIEKSRPLSSKGQEPPVLFTPWKKRGSCWEGCGWETALVPKRYSTKFWVTSCSIRRENRRF